MNLIFLKFNDKTIERMSWKLLMNLAINLYKLFLFAWRLEILKFRMFDESLKLFFVVSQF